MTKAKWIGAIGAALTMFVAPAAFAGELSEGKGGYGSAAALIGVGTADYSVFGLGLRGGYTFANTPVYVGGTFLYHFGSNNLSSMVLGVEGGYDFTVGPVIIRPYLGLGDVIVNFDPGTVFGVSVPSQSAGNFAFWPGGTVLYPINNFFVGGDMRLQVITGADGGDTVSFGIFGTGGIAF